jgi:hypothetical protein
VNACPPFRLDLYEKVKCGRIGHCHDQSSLKMQQSCIGPYSAVQCSSVHGVQCSGWCAVQCSAVQWLVWLHVICRVGIGGGGRSLPVRQTRKKAAEKCEVHRSNSTRFGEVKISRIRNKAVVRSDSFSQIEVPSIDYLLKECIADVN